MTAEIALDEINRIRFKLTIADESYSKYEDVEDIRFLLRAFDVARSIAIEIDLEDEFEKEFEKRMKALNYERT